METTFLALPLRFSCCMLQNSRIALETKRVNHFQDQSLRGFLPFPLQLGMLVCWSFHHLKIQTYQCLMKTHLNLSLSLSLAHWVLNCLYPMLTSTSPSCSLPSSFCQKMLQHQCLSPELALSLLQRQALPLDCWYFQNPHQRKSSSKMQPSSLWRIWQSSPRHLIRH